MLARLRLFHPPPRLPPPRLPTFTMATHTKADLSPPLLRGMKELDRAAFQKTIPIVAARFPAPMSEAVRSSPAIRKASIYVRSPLERVGDDRLILLDAPNEDALPQETKDYCKEHSISIEPYGLHLDYDHWNVEEILHSIMPEDLESPSSFTCVGHMAHLNLRDEFLPWKHIIGQVILDKNHRIRTVVNKTDTISQNIYRVFPMEILAGEPTTMVTHKESGCSFIFDLAEVYWNSRLSHEHERILNQFKPEDVVADIFAGVGPFALPAAKKGCAVLANDLNPNSYKSLRLNIENNRVSELVRPSCMDGRDFIRDVFNRCYDEPMPPVPPPKLSRVEKREARKKRAERDLPPAPDARREAARRTRITHVVMNLPETAIDFLNEFNGVLGPVKAQGRGLSGIYDSPENMPMIHCYCFTKILDYEAATVEIRQRVEAALGGKLEGDVESVAVRRVAPHKDMYCLSFRLPYKVAYGGT
ncbi:Met-10+ like-protein-domain-containing protein [Rhodofomes roseus]|uniref:tRNA (guanine(37)-N1)-methyltransferase n=1 Tax=Rhodofomes roseus TaxID=34475 RepID=A0ABQ8KHW6_9APHY|nr:Met-10+ like-protein-domain-containing protein [Rhodofomes roseus]KAH9837256.1 Met-10+ like-protein-domain-containing protein [Rhodofomes roseus]